jgi:ribosomal protein S12 methylthiotransferase accessory factor
MSGTAKLDLGGTFRHRHPHETLARVQPFLPAFGITRLANVTGLDRIGIPVWMCIRPNARCLSVSQGKGLSDELAQASAVMESIELYHAEHVAAPEMVASYREVRGRHAALDPRGLGRGIRWRAYGRDRKIAWIHGRDIATTEPVFVPHVRVNENWSRPHPDAGLFLVTTTGLASGNHRLEAVCHGLFEVVERDCEWRWERLSESARRARELDGETVEAPQVRWLLDRFADARIVVRIWDMTSDVGIPAYHCTISDPIALGGVDPIYGAGCHLSKEVALARALTEAAQSRLTFIAGSRDDVYPSLYDRTQYAAPRGPSPRGRCDFSGRRSPPAGATFEEDLHTALELLAEAGFRRVVAVEHTKPDVGIPVVTVIVPGMRELAEE